MKALHIRTTVLPGGKIEIVDRAFPVGESVDVVVIQSQVSDTIICIFAFRMEVNA